MSFYAPDDVRFGGTASRTAFESSGLLDLVVASLEGAELTGDPQAAEVERAAA